MTMQLSKDRYSNLCEPLIDNIISYLPYNEQKNINHKYRIKYVSIKKIIKAIKNNRVRMNTIMEYELPCSIHLMRAHYILHYPDEFRYEYFRNGLMSLARLEDDFSFLRYDQYLSIVSNESENNTDVPTKLLFKKLINNMSMIEIIIFGW